MKNIIITGASGLIGSALKKKLSEQGFNLVILSTSQSDHSKNIYKWDPRTKVCELLPDLEYFAIINLAGNNIAETRWNKRGKVSILKSRTRALRFLSDMVRNLKSPPKHFISASAIGYYGTPNNGLKTESSAPGNDFAAMVCQDWEKAVSLIQSPETQKSILRIGIVLGCDGGFYQKIQTLSKWKIAAPIGTGNQPVSWIHLDDLVNIFVSILEGKIEAGTYNAAAGFNSNKEIIKKITLLNGQSWLWPAIPSFLLKIIFGEKSEILTGGTQVSSAKLIGQGFQFQFDNLDLALSHIVNKTP